jgi:hypothetical protein
MTVERIGSVVPAADLAATVALLRTVFGAEPTFVDGDRWAQFDAHGARVAVAGLDRDDDLPALSVKVSDLDAAVARLRRTGLAVPDPVTGPHERRVLLRPAPDASWSILLYGS